MHLKLSDEDVAFREELRSFFTPSPQNSVHAPPPVPRSGPTT